MTLNYKYLEACTCTSFYFNYLWTACKQSTFDKLRVAAVAVVFNNAYRRVSSLAWRSSCASTMYANFGIQNFEAVMRKSTFRFIQRLAKSTNSLIMAIKYSWIVRIDIWDFWQKNTVHYSSNINFSELMHFLNVLILF